MNLAFWICIILCIVVAVVFALFNADNNWDDLP